MILIDENTFEAFRNMLVAVVGQIPDGHEVAGFAVQIMSTPVDGGQAKIVGAHQIARHYTLQETDMLDDFIEALQSALASRLSGEGSH